jgi:protein required for attachment to host cells
MRVPHKTLIAVADGRKLLFLRNDGDAELPVFHKVKVAIHANPADHDQKTDLAGQAPGGAGQGGATMGEADYHQLEEDRFAAEVAELLKTRAMNGDFESLKEVSDRLRGEIGKDLTNHPVDEIERIVTAAE